MLDGFLWSEGRSGGEGGSRSGKLGLGIEGWSGADQLVVATRVAVIGRPPTNDRLDRGGWARQHRWLCSRRSFLHRFGRP